MKIFTVLAAPDIPVEEAFFVNDGDLTPSVFATRAEADDFAKYAARQQPDTTFWVVEGEAVTAFVAEPLPVTEVAVEVRSPD